MQLLVLNVAQTFNLSPSDAWAELYERNPAGWVQQLLSIETFRNAWRALRVETARTNKQDWQSAGAVAARERVLDAEFAVARLAAEAQRAERAERDAGRD